MSLRTQSHVSEVAGPLQHCLVDGNSEQLSRERRIRRRSLAISVVLQSAALAVVILIPLFGKPERIAWASTPIPPYYPPGVRTHAIGTQHSDAPRRPCFFCPNPAGARIAAPAGQTINSSTTDDAPLIGDPNAPEGAGMIPLVDPRTPQVPQNPQPEQTRVLKITHIDPAMLINRIEPTYPPLARQTHRSGRVELHAMIATDGTIQSLQVISGDFLFYRSAMEAVQQWRYRPTILNGQPVEIDTFITVVYNMDH
ncbi:MAG TPA: energy transducer TonB [Candidatus Acidoferrum sp.]|jgi:protein TonB